MRHPIAVCVYAAAMGILEAIVVVYLRRIYYPGGFGFPLVEMDPSMLRIEVIREAMTLIMLGAVAWIAADRAWNRLLAFIVAFGIWDILYYAGLKISLNWPASWLEPDILFLIPRVWIGPVLAPILVSLAWVVGGLWLHRVPYDRLGMGWKSWAAAIGGAALILAAFLSPGTSPEAGAAGAPSFPWLLFGAGFVLGTATLARLGIRSRHLGRN